MEVNGWRMEVNKRRMSKWRSLSLAASGSSWCAANDRPATIPTTQFSCVRREERCLCCVLLDYFNAFARCPRIKPEPVKSLTSAEAVYEVGITFNTRISLESSFR